MKRYLPTTGSMKSFLRFTGMTADFCRAIRPSTNLRKSERKIIFVGAEAKAEPVQMIARVFQAWCFFPECGSDSTNAVLS